MRQQRRGIYQAIESEKFDPSDFKWQTVHDESANIESPELVHLPTDAHFHFSVEISIVGDDREFCEWSPGDGIPAERAYGAAWDDQRDHVYQWLRNIRREFYDPDPWDSIAPIAGSHAGDASHFNPDERAEVSTRLREILDYIGELRELSEAEKQEVEERFVVPLEDASGRVTRGQWKLMFYGALVTEGVHVGFSSPIWQQIAHFAVQSVAHLFGVPLPALPPGG